MQKKQETTTPTLSQVRHPAFVRREWLHVAILTVIMATMWAVTSVYFVIFQAHIPQPLARRIQQFSPNLDVGVLSVLENYSQFSGSDITEDQRVILKTRENQPTSAPLPTPTASQVVGGSGQVSAPSITPTPISSPTPTSVTLTETPTP